MRTLLPRLTKKLSLLPEAVPRSLVRTLRPRPPSVLALPLEPVPRSLVLSRRPRPQNNLRPLAAAQSIMRLPPTTMRAARRTKTPLSNMTPDVLTHP